MTIGEKIASRLKAFTEQLKEAMRFKNYWECSFCAHKFSTSHDSSIKAEMFAVENRCIPCEKCDVGPASIRS